MDDTSIPTAARCAHCGDPRTSRHGRYCGKRECKTAREREQRANGPRCSQAGCEQGILGRGLCATHYSADWRSKKQHAKVCAVCGSDFASSRRGQVACSLKCVSVLGGKKLRQQAEARRKANSQLVPYTGPKHTTPEVVHVKTAHRLTSGICRVCETWFISAHLDVTCSSQCAADYRQERRRIHKARRLTRKRGAYVADVYRKKVYEADGYRCHICRRKTDPTKTAPHPKAPTIDHVIPLALGGTHEPLNCRTACFLCNCTKAHTGHGDQMLLIAI